MRTKPNKYKVNSEHSHWPHNDLYRKFRREFDLILQGDSPCVDDSELMYCYVENEFIEEKLNYILDSGSDTIQFLLGRTGIGKSTVLRHVFNTSRKPIIHNSSLIIPFSFNGMNINESDNLLKLSAIIRTASKLLLKHYSLNIEEDEFFYFIEDHAPDVLMRSCLDIQASDKELLRSFRSNDPYSFALEEFKFFLHKAPIKRSVFVVDDIESETQAIQEVIIESICRLYSCIRNYKSRKSNINVLFSVRPVTEKLARKNKEINAFPLSKPIIIKQPIPLSKLFQARMEYAMRDIGSEHVKNQESWKEALSILLSIVEQISDKYGYGLLKLFNNNIRRTLIEFQYLITNRVWLQKNNPPRPSFKINLGDFSINNASIFRALGMRNGFLYPAEGTCLVNCFWNKPEDSYDLLIWYIILFLMERNEGNEYLDAIVEKNEMFEIFKKLFVIDNFESVMERTIEKMRDYKLIETEYSNNYTDKLTQYIVLQPRAQQLWMILGETDVVLEMFRDDTYQTFQNRPKKLSTSLASDETFDDIFNFINEIFKWEKSRIDGFKINDPKLASRVFGGSYVYEQSLSGIRNSLYAYYHEQEDIPLKLRENLTTAYTRLKMLKY